MSIRGTFPEKCGALARALAFTAALALPSSCAKVKLIGGPRAASSALTESPFTIAGITGAGDATADAYLLDGTIATASWTAAVDLPGSFAYEATIYQSDGTTVQCATQSLTPPATSATFSGCVLSYKSTYKLSLRTITASGKATSATGSPFSFYVNRSPSAVSDTFLVAKNAGATTISVLTNDTDADGDSLFVSSVTGNGAASAGSIATAGGGTVTNSGSSVSYAPANGFTGVDSFSYAVSDGQGGTASATVTVRVMDPFSWTGALSSLWSASGNWCGAIVGGACQGGPAPNATQVAIFDAACTSCNVTIDVPASVQGISMRAGYGGQISQGAGIALTVGTSGFTQASGTFLGSNGPITLNGDFALSGAASVFRATSGTLLAGGSWSVTGTPTFNANSGTLEVKWAGPGASKTIVPGGATYNNVSFTTDTYSNYDLGGATMSIGGNLLLAGGATNGALHAGGLYNGTLRVLGNVTSADHGVASGSNATVLVAGTANQTITGVSGGLFPSLTIASTGGTVTMAGNIDISGSYINSSGTLDALTSSPRLSFLGNASPSGGQSYTLTPGTTHYNDITFTDSNFPTFNLGGGSLYVDGTLRLAGAPGVNINYAPVLTNGTVVASGDVTVSDYGLRSDSTATLLLAGSTNQTLTGVAAGLIPNLAIASTGGIVTLAGEIVIAGDYTYSSGTVDALSLSPKLVFVGGSRGGGATFTLSPGSVRYYDVTIGGANFPLYNLGGGEFLIEGTLRLAGAAGVTAPYSPRVNNGTLKAFGDVIISAFGLRSDSTGTILLAGGANQTLTGVATGSIPNLAINSTGGTVTLAGEIVIQASYAYLGGTVDAATQSSTLNFVGQELSRAFAINPGAVQYHNVSFTSEAYPSYDLGGNTFIVGGTLRLASAGNGVPWAPSVNNGTLRALGNVVASGFGIRVQSTAQLLFAGVGAQTLTQAATAELPGGTFTLNNAAGLTLGSSVSLTGAGQLLDVVAGPVNLGANALSVGSLSLNGNTLTKSGGALTVGGTAIGAGALFGGTIAP